MIEPPVIVDIPAQLVARIPIVVARDAIQPVMRAGIDELFGTIAAQGIAPAGPWFTHHRRRPTDTFDFAISVPVATSVTASGRVEPGERAAAAVARTVYRGPYDRLGDAWTAFMAWLGTSGRTRREDMWETYLDGPATVGDPALYRTELNQPLAG